MDHFARVQLDNEEGKKRTEEEVGDLQKIAGPDIYGMIVQEGGPVLPLRSRCAYVPHVLLDGPFTHTNIELDLPPV